MSWGARPEAASRFTSGARTAPTFLALALSAPSSFFDEPYAQGSCDRGLLRTDWIALGSRYTTGSATLVFNGTQATCCGCENGRRAVCIESSAASDVQPSSIGGSSTLPTPTSCRGECSAAFDGCSSISRRGECPAAIDGCSPIGQSGSGCDARCVTDCGRGQGRSEPLRGCLDVALAAALLLAMAMRQVCSYCDG